MATVYLHIGTPKTGTTAIQHLLVENRELLERHQMIYPDFGFRYENIGEIRNGHFLVAPFQNPDGTLDETRPSPDYEKGLELLAQTGETFDTILLSDEGVWNASQWREDFWGVLKRDMQARGLDLRIIVYLRRQDLIVQSMYVQELRQTDFSGSFSEFLDYTLHKKYPSQLDYDTYLCRLAELFGWESLYIRVYEKEQFAGPQKNLYSDFLSILGLQMSDGFQTQKTRYNERMDKNLLEMKRLLNLLPKQLANDDLLMQAMRTVQDVPIPAKDEDCTYFEPEAQKKFLDSYAEGNSHLARTYFKRPDGQLFCEPLTALPMLSIADRKLLDHTILVYGQVLEILSQRTERQRNHIQKLEERALTQRDRIQKLNQDIRAQQAQIKKLDETIRELREDVLWYRLKRKARHLTGREKKNDAEND